jgi:Cu+-exporting ATPase
MDSRDAIRGSGPGAAAGEAAVTLSVEGMHCSTCVASVEGALSRIDGVKKASVNFMSKEVWVEYDPSLTGPSAFRNSIQKIGFSVVDRQTGAQPGVSEDPGMREARKMRARLLVSILFSIPVLVLSMGPMIGLHLPLGAAAQGLVLAVLSLPVYAWGGWPFHRGAVARLRHGGSDMNTLVSLATTAAFVYSVLQTLMPDRMPGGGKFMYDSSVMIITIVLVGRSLEARATGKAGQELARLALLRPVEAHLEVAGRVENVPVSRVGAGDVVVVHPGEKVPLDGVIAEGAGAFDESMITGEGMPAVREAGQPVIGGTINTGSLVRVRVTKTGDETFLARIMRAVAQAQASKPPIQNLADRIASVFVPVVIAVALATFALWTTFGPPQAPGLAVMAAVSVLVIACPCALGLATPAAVSIAVGRAARSGIFIRRGEGFERLRRADTFVFDKTGTLTRGKPEVTDVVAAEGFDERTVVQAAAAVESGGAHPLGAAILARSKNLGPADLDARSPESVPGKGMSALLGGRPAHVGSDDYMKEKGIDISGLEPAARRLRREGKSVVFVAAGGKAAGLIAVADPVREDAARVIAALGKAGAGTILLTGDSETAAAAVKEKLGIDEVFARLLPEDKSRIIGELQRKGRKVAMIGDGVNDAPSLAAADSGSVAMGTGSDVAVETADAGLMGTSLAPLLDLVRLSKKTVRVIRQNFFWAFLYNVLAIPVAAGVLYPLWGLLLSPTIAAAAMSLSSISVVLSSLRLRRP